MDHLLILSITGFTATEKFFPSEVRPNQWSFNLTNQIGGFLREGEHLHALRRIRLELDGQPIFDVPFSPDDLPVPLELVNELVRLRQRVAELEAAAQEEIPG